MKDRIANFVLILAILSVVAIIGFDFGRSFPREPGIIERTDTVIVTRVDTLFREVLEPVYSTVIRTEYVAVTDTIVRNDTTFLPLPIEQKVYEDSTYRAVVSGYKPNLDSLWLYRTTKYVTVTNTVKGKPSKFGFGVTVGPSILITPRGSVYGGLGATLGVDYRF